MRHLISPDLVGRGEMEHASWLTRPMLHGNQRSWMEQSKAVAPVAMGHEIGGKSSNTKVHPPC